MQRDEENRGRGPSKHVCSSLARRRCRGRRRPATQGRPLAALTLGFVLVGAAAVSGSANNPPPPPPASLANGRQEDRWASWAPPPPGPPPSDPAVPGSGGRAAGGGGDAAAAGGGGMGGGMGGVWGAESPDYSQGAGQGAAQEDDSCDSLMGGRSSVQPGMMGQDMASQGDARGMGHGGFGPPGMGATGGESAGHFRDTEQVAAGETQQQMQERMIREGRGSHVQHQQQQYRRQQQYQPPRPPPSWSSNAPQDSTPHQQRDQLYDESSGPVNGNGHPARPVPDLHANSMLQQQRSGTGIMGGAGEGAAGGAAGGRWEPPSAARAGAVTPEVKLSQYRQGGAGAADGRADVAGGSMQEGDMSRALLSNTDKEVIFDGLKKLYRKKILPLEESSRYAHFHSPPMNPADFEAKPMVLIVGQYSVGKTSFIRSLLKRDFPGQRVGPEPTTDRFVAVTHGEDERVMPGHALAMQADKPFRSLQQFGNNFLTKFEGSVVDAAILRNITLVDTPGVLSGEKQRIGRDYDFASVISWFAERADLIVVMFDAHKLDISDELKMVIDTLKPHHDKMRVLLNKADTIDTQQLMRVYGALMWSLGKVMQTPEVCRVYIGSFWEAPLSNSENRFLLDKEKNDLLEELMLLPENAVVRRINELVKRARSVKVHAYIIHYLRKQMPYVMGKQDKQEKLIRRLDQEFLACARRYGLPLGDFPKVEKFRRSLREIKDISKFKSLDKSLVHEMDKVFSSDIPKLMEKAARPGNR